MIDFLQQLERDLVKAIDRREAAPAPRRRRRLRVDLVAAAAALAAAIALVLLLNSHKEKEEPVTHPTTPTVTNPRPVPKGTPLQIRGNVRRVGSDTWTGRVPGPGGGAGTLTLTGPVELTPRPCCEGFHQANTHVLQFSWTSPRGTIGGCVVNTIYRRPHTRFVWDGPGRVKVATGAFARYRGRAIGFGGVSDIRLTTRAFVVFGHDGRPPGRC
jgi:hypothetical protein